MHEDKNGGSAVPRKSDHATFDNLPPETTRRDPSGRTSGRTTHVKNEDGGDKVHNLAHEVHEEATTYRPSQC